MIKGKIVWFSIEDLIKFKLIDPNRSYFFEVEEDKLDIIKTKFIEVMTKQKYVFFEDEIKWKIRVDTKGKFEFGMQFKHIE